MTAKRAGKEIEVSVATVVVSSRTLVRSLAETADATGTTKGISPGIIIITPLANDELSGPSGANYRCTKDLWAGPAGSPDEVGTVGVFLMEVGGAFVTGSDFFMDGGDDCILVW